MPKFVFGHIPETVLQNPVSPELISTLSSRLLLRFPSGHFLRRLPTNTLYAFKVKKTTVLIVRQGKKTTTSFALQQKERNTTNVCLFRNQLLCHKESKNYCKLFLLLNDALTYLRKSLFQLLKSYILKKNS
jgi:hypothetical protein